MYEARGDSRRIPTRANSNSQVHSSASHMVRLSLSSMSSPSFLQNRAAANPSSQSSKEGQAMTPDQALKNFMHKLTNFEHHEIYNYPNVYFVGQGARKKTPSSHSNANNNDGYDDEQGSYMLVAHDHIAYRYEIIKVIGKSKLVWLT